MNRAHFRSILTIAGLLLLICSCHPGRKATENPVQDSSGQYDGWISLFNGKDLEGWTARGNAEWTVKDGTIVGQSGEGHGHIYAGPELADLEVKGKFRLSDQGGGGNSGLYFRANPSANNPDGYPRGYEAQICHNQDAHTGWLWKPGTPTGKANALLSKDDEWFTMRVRAEGSLIRIWVNDQLVMTHEDAEYDKGFFAIQCHNPGMTIEARELYYRELSDKMPEPPIGYRSEFWLKIAYTRGTLKLIEPTPQIPDHIEVHRDLVYKILDSVALKLDVYQSKEVSEPAPLLIFIHGGGWSKGDKSDYLPYLIDFAKKGYVTASVSYRLSGIAKYPAAVEDVISALQWIQDCAGDYMIDPNRIALVGGSAGGHLAMMAAYGAVPLDGIRAVVNFYGPSDLTTPYARQRHECQNFLGRSYEESPELYLAASPKVHISGDDPPTLIFHGTIDSLVPVSQSDSLHKWLKDNDVYTEYYRLEGWPHTMDLSKEVNAYCQYQMDAFFRDFL